MPKKAKDRSAVEVGRLKEPGLHFVGGVPGLALQVAPGTALVFPSTKNTPLSDMTLSAVLRRMGLDAVPHGFRSTFRDWAAERTNFPREVAEMALAHAIGDKVEAAYRRGDLLGKRVQLMAAWAKFCDSPVSGGRVVALFERPLKGLDHPASNSTKSP